MRSMADALGRHPLAGWLLLIAASVVIIGGAVVAIVNPNQLDANDYFRDVAIVAAALGIGLGVATNSGVPVRVVASTVTTKGTDPNNPEGLE